MLEELPAEVFDFVVGGVEGGDLFFLCVALSLARIRVRAIARFVIIVVIVVIRRGRGRWLVAYTLRLLRGLQREEGRSG